MSVSEQEFQDAFRFFLGRRPGMEPLPRFENVSEMQRSLLRSAEFRASPRARKTALGWPLGQVFISRKAKVIYCPIGKNACTFLKRQMLAISDVENPGYLLRDIHLLTDYVRTGLQLSDYTPEEVAGFIASPSFLKVAVLRDPADRLLSAYVEKFVTNRLAAGNIHHTRPVVAAVQAAEGIASPDFDRGISFRQFIGQITSVPPETLDPHWRPQALYLEGIVYDRLYGFGEINLLVDELERRSGIALPRQPQNVTGSGRSNVIQPGASELLPGQLQALPRLAGTSYLDPDLRERIAGYFAADYALLQRTEPAA